MASLNTPPDGRRGLVGRERELRELTGGVLSAVSGTGELYLVHGDPGIGKSRLVDAVAEVAETNGVTTHWGRCWEVGGAPAYWPWIQVLRSVIDGVEVAELGAIPGVVTLGQLLPDLAGSVPGPKTTTRLEPDQARFQLMDAVAGVVRTASRSGPVAVFLEDLHSADPASLTLLDFLARQVRKLPVLLIGTYREAEAHREGVGDGLTRIAREARTSIPLGPMSLGEVSDCVRRATGIEPGPRVATAIHRASEGNPLYAIEIAGLMASRGFLDNSEDRVDIAIPDSLRAVIRERAADLDVGTLDLLQTASVLGREFSTADLANLHEVELGEVERPLADAAQARVVEDLDGGRYRFNHILTCEVFHSGLFLERRRSLHRRWAEKIEALHGGGAGTPWTDLAHHLLAAGPQVLPRAVDACIRAAEQALEQLAFDDAAELFGRAVELYDRSSQTGPSEFPALLLNRAQALIKAGRVDAGRTVCADAAGEARRLGDSGLLARAALVYGSVFVHGDVDRGLIDLLQEALDQLGDGDSAVRARLQARLAAALQPSEKPEEAFEIARDAIAMARRVGDRSALLDAIRSGCSALMDLADPAERLALNREHVELASELGQDFDAFRGHMRIVIDAAELGDLETADAAILACQRLAGETELPHHLWTVASFRAMRASMSGRFEEAANWMEESALQANRVEDPNASRSIALQHLGLVRTQESFADMITGHRQLQDRFPGSDFTSLFVWLICGSDFVRMERHDRVPVGVVQRGSEIALTYGDPTLLGAVSEVAASPEHLETAELLVDRLLPKKGQWITWGLFGMTVEAPVSRYLALLASALGRAEDVDEYFEDAISRARALEALPVVSRTSYEFARHLQGQGGENSSDRVSELLQEAGRIAEELGQTGLLELIRSAQAEVLSQ